MKDSLKDYSNQIPERPGFLTKQSTLRQKTHKDMQAVMEKSLFLALLISGLSGTSSVYSRYYYFVNESMTWLEAQSYCRAKYIDLATVDNMEDMKRLMKSVDPKFSGSLWIGLNKVPPRRWGWSSGEISQYMNWNKGEPNNGDEDGLCATKTSLSGWADYECSSSLSFVCYNELSRTYIVIDELFSWRSAQDYCRQHYTDLATIHNVTENQYLSVFLSNYQMAWIGLFFDNWKWSDQQNSTFRYWKSGQPHGTDCNCAFMETQFNGQWNSGLCNTKIPFMCYKDKTRRIMRLKITSGGQNLNDPAMETAILNMIDEKLRSQGVGSDTTLSWRVRNGKVFHCDKNMTMIKENKCV